MRSEESSVWYYSGHAESDMIGKVLRISELKGANGRRHIHEFNFIIVLYNSGTQTVGLVSFVTL